MRTVKAPDERRQEILDTAIRVFARKGYEKTTIADIAREMGVSQGLCYRYFPSKELIYDAAVDEYADYIAQTNIAGYDCADRPLAEQIRRMSGDLRRYITAEQGQADLYEMFHQAGNRRLHDELFLRVARRLVPFLADVIAQAKARGETAVADPESAACFLVYGQMGILMRHDLTVEQQAQRIQTCAAELLGL